MNITSAWWHWLAMSLWGCYHGDVKLKALLCVREQPHRAAGVAADPSQFHRTQGDIIRTRLSWKVWLFGLSTQYMTSTNRGHILCSDFVNRGVKKHPSATSWLVPSSSSHRWELVLLRRALRLGLAVCPFRLWRLHSVSLLLKMRSCWEEGDRCAAVMVNKLKNITLPAAPAEKG